MNIIKDKKKTTYFIEAKKPPNFLSGFSYFAPPTMGMSSQFNEEFIKLALFNNILNE